MIVAPGVGTSGLSKPSGTTTSTVAAVASKSTGSDEVAELNMEEEDLGISDLAGKDVPIEELPGATPAKASENVSTSKLPKGMPHGGLFGI